MKSQANNPTLEALRDASATRTAPRGKNCRPKLMAAVSGAELDLPQTPEEFEQTIAEIAQVDTEAPEVREFSSFEELEEYSAHELVRIYMEGLSKGISDQQMAYAESLVRTVREHPDCPKELTQNIRTASAKPRQVTK